MTDGPCSYVGHTGKDGKDVDVRLAEHNETEVKGRGAEETRGKKWKIVESPIVLQTRLMRGNSRNLSIQMRWSVGKIACLSLLPFARWLSGIGSKKTRPTTMTTSKLLSTSRYLYRDIVTLDFKQVREQPQCR